MLDIMKKDVVEAGLFIGESVTFTNNSPSAVEELNVRVMLVHGVGVVCDW